MVCDDGVPCTDDTCNETTDSCDYTIQQKTEHNTFAETPGGLPGIETLLPLMYTLFVDDLAEPVETIIRLMTTVRWWPAAIATKRCLTIRLTRKVAWIVTIKMN